MERGKHEHRPDGAWRLARSAGHGGFPTLARLLAAALVLLAVAPPVAAQSGDGDRQVSADYRISLRYDTKAGDIDIEERIAGLDRDLSFAAPPWLSLVAARLAGAGGGSLSVGDNSIHVPAAALAGHTLELKLRGRVPSATVAPQDAMAGPGGGYLFGNAGWLPGPAPGLARYTVTLTVPSAHRAIATGKLVS